MRRWFGRANNPEAYSAWRQGAERKRAFTALLVRTRDRLAAAYGGDAAVEQRKLAKARILQEATEEYAALKQGWGGYAGYDKWFTATPLNNAKLVSATLYADRVPAFGALLAQAGGDLSRFYAEVRTLAQLSQAEREARLAEAEGYKLAATPATTANAP